jgi:hypothetical protein
VVRICPGDHAARRVGDARKDHSNVGISSAGETADELCAIERKTTPAIRSC